jgi:serine/threonine protein kinase
MTDVEKAAAAKVQADAGDPIAQCTYGFYLENGTGVPKDLKEAVRYYKLSADQGNAYGQNNYGRCLECATGVPKDLKEAARYYKLSADQGNENARLGRVRCEAAVQSNLASVGLINLDNLNKVKELGTGRFGTVWKVEDGKTKKTLAVKYIRVGVGFDAVKLLREVEILSLLNHPCIVGLIGWSLPNDKCRKARIAMEYLCNGSLESALMEVNEGRPPSFWTHENVTLMIIGILLGMRYVHSKDIVHRDLKPGNILLDENYRIRICDFGTSRLEVCGILTTEFIGTFAYMAPETFEGSVPTKKVDVFAFGLILYEMLVGQSVFRKSETPARICKLHDQRYRPSIPSSVSRVVANVIQKCWAHEPDDRPDFEEIFATLEGAWFPFFRDVSSEIIEEFIAKMNS